MAWIDTVKAVPFPEIAAEIGLETARNHSFKPCPSCKVEVRGSNDHRGPIGISSDAAGWCCHHCGARGDVVDLVSLWIVGNKLKSVDRESKVLVREWFERKGYCEGVVRTDRKYSLPACKKPSDSSRVVDEAYVYVKPQRPPLEEVRGLWKSSIRLTDALQAPEMYSDPLLTFLADRSFSVSDLDRAGVFKIIPEIYDHPWPSWWPKNWASNWRMVTPAYEPDGSFASLHGRGMRSLPGQPKTRWPLGFSAGGLFMANRAGVMMMRGREVRLDGLIICEGFTDLMRASSAVVRENLDFAILSATSGSFKAIKSVKIPPGVPVYLATDPDDAGKRYAKIVKDNLKNHQIFHLPLT